MTNLWARKSIAALRAEAEERDVQALTTHGGIPLKRTLSATSLVALGIGAIVGAGIFVLTGHAAAVNAGPAIGLSFVLSAIACAFAGLCYAEMASTVPISGSAYTYAYATMGEIVAWIIGWDLILEYALGATTVAIGWSGYAVSLLGDFGIVVPDRYAQSPFAYDPANCVWHLTGALLNVPAMAVIAAISALLIVGVHDSARVNNIIVVIKVAIIVVFVGVGAWFVSTSNWVTAGNPEGAFIPPNLGPGQYGWSGVVRGAAVVFFAYIGFDAVSTAAQEANNPKRDMPIGILGSLAICTVLYLAVGFVLTGIVPYDQLNVADPIAVGIDAIGMKWLAPIVKLGVDRRCRDHPFRAAADWSGRRVGQRRTCSLSLSCASACSPCGHATATAAPVQDAGSLRRGARRCRHGAVPHVRAAARHLDTLRHMAGARPRCLRALRKQAQPDWTNRHSPVPLIAGK